MSFSKCFTWLRFFVKLDYVVFKLPLMSVEFAKVFFVVSFSGLKRQYFCFRSAVTALPGFLTIIIYLWAPFKHSATQVWSLLDVNIQLCIYWNARVYNMELMCDLHSLWNLIKLSSKKLMSTFSKAEPTNAFITDQYFVPWASGLSDLRLWA